MTVRHVHSVLAATCSAWASLLEHGPGWERPLSARSYLGHSFSDISVCKTLPAANRWCLLVQGMTTMRGALGALAACVVLGCVAVSMRESVSAPVGLKQKTPS